MPAMQPLDSTVWWLMLARTPGRGDQTDRRAQRSTVWGPRPRAARPRRIGPHQPRLQAGWGAAWPRGHRQRGTVGRVSRPSDLPTRKEPTWLPGLGLSPGSERRFSARRKDCLVLRRQREGGPGSRFLACQLQAPLCGTEAGGGREACSPNLEGGSAAGSLTLKNRKWIQTGGSGQRDSGSWFDPLITQRAECPTRGRTNHSEAWAEQAARGAGGARLVTSWAPSSSAKSAGRPHPDACWLRSWPGMNGFALFLPRVP